MVQTRRAEAAAHQQGHRTKHQTESQQAHQSTWAALRATGTVAIPTGESTADSPSADCIRDSEVRRDGGSGIVERRRDGTQPTPGKRPDGRSSRWLSAGTGMAVREAWCSPAQSGDVVPKYSTMRLVRRTARRADRPVGADVSLRALRVALRPGPQRGPEPETSRPCFMGDDKRTWRRCKSGPRAGDCQRSVYWTWQSPTGPDSCVMRRLWSIMAIMPNPS